MRSTRSASPYQMSRRRKPTSGSPALSYAHPCRFDHSLSNPDRIPSRIHRSKISHPIGVASFNYSRSRCTFSSVGDACSCAATVTLTTAAPRYRICHGTTTLGRNRRWDNYSIRRQVVSHGPFLRPDPPPVRNRPAAFVDRTTAVTRVMPSTRRPMPIPRLSCASFDRSSKRGSFIRFGFGECLLVLAPDRVTTLGTPIGHGGLPIVEVVTSLDYPGDRVIHGLGER